MNTFNKKLSLGILVLVTACGGSSSKKSLSDGVNDFSEVYNPKACESTSTVNDLVGKKWFVFSPSSSNLDTDGYVSFESNSITFTMTCSDGSVISTKSSMNTLSNTLSILEDKETTSSSEPGCAVYVQQTSNVTFKVEADKLVMCDPLNGNATFYSR